MGYAVAVFGAFNIKSFGDTMFPKALLNEMSKRVPIDAFVMFSPGRLSVGYEDNRQVYSYEEFEEVYERIKFDVIVIGGGELLHNKPITFKEGNIVYPAGEIWKVPIQYGKKYNIPVILNSVGMPFEFTEDERKKVKPLFEQVNYISLRDNFSFERWNKSFGCCSNVQLVPDSLWRIQDYMSVSELNECRQALKKKYGIGSDYLIFQYGTTKEWQEAAEIVERFGKNNKLQVIAIMVNACHDDFVVVKHLKKDMLGIISVTDVLSPTEIVALISGAKMFIGTSLHGNLVATVYGVRNVIIDMYPDFVSKMDGFSEMIGYTDNFVNEIRDFWYVLNKIYAEDISCLKNRIEKLKSQTKAHFDRICEIIQSNAISPLSLPDEQQIDAGVLFRKAYLKISNEDGIRHIHKVIAKCIGDRFKFSFTCPEVREDDVVEFVEPISGVVQVEVENEANIVASSNKFENDLYVAPMVRWKLVQQNRYDFVCRYEQMELEKVVNTIFTAYYNETIHCDQLMMKEREYRRELVDWKDINDNTVEALEIKNAECEQLEEQLVKKEVQYKIEVEGLTVRREKLEETISQLEAQIKSDELEFIQLRQEILNKEGHIELLLPAEREYNKIIHSKMFKIMRACCRTIDIILVVPKYVAKKMIAFIKMLSHVNIPKLKIALGYVKHEGLGGAYRHLMRDYHQGELPKIEVDVDNKIYEEIRDIKTCEVLEFPTCDNPIVSIVIPAYNQFTYTYYCLKSILDNSGDVGYEVILADDCSTDITTQITEVVKNIIVARTKTNLLFLKNCNNAACRARGKYILFLNNDTQVQKGWLKPLVDICEKDDSIGLTGSKLVYSDGTLQEAGGIIWNDASGWNYGRNCDAMSPEYNYVREVDYISGAAIMIRKELWIKLGGFDEYFAPAYYEDSDLAFQVRKAGYRVVYQPLSVVVHFEGKSNGTDLNVGVKKNQVENQVKFRKKWKEILEKEQYPNAQEVFLANDRSRFKKRILVVDHYVPHYDKDAGGRCTYMYLKLFVKLGFKVVFIGDNFFKHEPYTTELTQMGIEVLYGNYYFEHWQEWLKDNLHYFDYIYLQRPHIAIKYIDLVKKYATGKVFYFAHDLHFLRLTREYELTHDEKYLVEAEKFKKDEFYLFEKADVVHVVGSYEQAVLQKELPSKAVRNIPLYIYEELLENINKDFAKRNDIVFVGGFGHPPNIDAVLWFAKEVFPKILQVYPDLVWHIVGGKAPKEVTDLASDNIVLEGFLSDEDLDKMYRKCRMAVVPLRVGAGVKGKVVEAAYYQIPLVTTTIGEEGISNKEGAFAVEDDADKMADLIISLYTDYDKLREMSDAGVELIRNHYMLDEAERVLRLDL